MGTKSLVMLKTHIDSINMRLVNGFVSVNMLWAFGSLRVFICNYVLYSLGLILRYFFRFLKVGDAEKEIPKSAPQADGTERNHFADFGIDGFQEELANFLFWSDVHQGCEEREGETESSASMDTVSYVPEVGEKLDGKKECFVFREIHSDIREDREKTEVHTESSVSKENVHEDDVERRTEEDGSAFMKSDDCANCVIHKDGKNSGVEAERFVFIETESDFHEEGKKNDEDETESSVFMENSSGAQYDSMNREEEEEEETSEPIFVVSDFDVHEGSKKVKEDETERSVFMQRGSSVNEDVKKIDENDTECSVYMEDGSNVHDDSRKREEEEVEGPVFVETDSKTTTSKCQYMSGKDIISGFIEEPTAMSFSFREFYMGPDVLAVSDNACASTVIIADKEFSELDSEKDAVALEEKEKLVQEQVSIIPSSTTDIPFRFESEGFGGTDSSDEDQFLFNENSLESDSESDSSSSSGLIWGNNNKIDDPIAYQFLGGENISEGFESEILKLMMKEERIEGVEEKQFSCGREVSAEDRYIEMKPGMKDLKSLNALGFGDKDKKEGSHQEEEACRKEKNEETKWEEALSESEADEQDEDDFEWEHDDLVEQLKMELRNARQGGLATILEEEKEEEEEEEEEEQQQQQQLQESESPKVVEDLKLLNVEEKLEFKDQIDEIEKVYKSYAEKMRKLDILNYQTMHALGLLQLKDPLKLISIPKSTIPSAKPVITQNLWPRKASKNTSDPLLKFVHELHRDLELVYVGQVCLSWEILCWQHKKAQELQQYDSQGSHRYNLVAGEFQLFQVLMQRFIENEPFQQGPRIQNYVKNRCVIRNLLQVPAIKDDTMKDKNITKDDEEDAIASGRLADIIKESMSVFWEFVKADKDYGNVILEVSQQVGADLKDPAISGLLVDIRTQLQKKEKKLKDIVRSGNCIVKKFQKHHEDQLDHEQLVAQVGLRLISRVLNMSKLRKEQLIWCHEKLHRIKFLSRKIVQVEPSFLLFPC